MFTKTAITALALTVALLTGCNKAQDVQQLETQQPATAAPAAGGDATKQRFENPRDAYNAHKAQQDAAAKAAADKPKQ